MLKTEMVVMYNSLVISLFLLLQGDMALYMKQYVSKPTVFSCYSFLVNAEVE